LSVDGSRIEKTTIWSPFSISQALISNEAEPALGVILRGPCPPVILWRRADHGLRRELHNIAESEVEA